MTDERDSTPASLVPAAGGVTDRRPLRRCAVSASARHSTSASLGPSRDCDRSCGRRNSFFVSAASSFSALLCSCMWLALLLAVVSSCCGEVAGAGLTLPLAPWSVGCVVYCDAANGVCAVRLAVAAYCLSMSDNTDSSADGCSASMAVVCECSSCDTVWPNTNCTSDDACRIFMAVADRLVREARLTSSSEQGADQPVSYSISNTYRQMQRHSQHDTYSA